MATEGVAVGCDYNHMVGIKVVGEAMPSARNTVTLADEVDRYGLKIARVTYGWTPEDKALVAHSLDQMQACLEAPAPPTSSSMTTTPTT